MRWGTVEWVRRGGEGSKRKEGSLILPCRKCDVYLVIIEVWLLRRGGMGWV